MKSLLRGIGFFALSIVVGMLVKKVWLSGIGRWVMDRVGHPELASHEMADEASARAKDAVNLVRSLTSSQPPAPPAPRETSAAPQWVRTARDGAEMLLAAGALLKSLSDFVQEDERLRRRLAFRSHRAS
ncbi:MAG TPA: hypothetical protein VNG11_06730 [Chloroflexota bacterium]|nr:hypothetical protein [Chloroflexota bacterium]